MPLFTKELNRLADSIGASDLTIWLHTAAPVDSDTGFDDNRTTVGGGAYENGATLTAANISTAANGDISNSADIDFGTADENVGTVNHWTAVRGPNQVAYGTLPETTINAGISFTIKSGQLQFNGSTL